MKNDKNAIDKILRRKIPKESELEKAKSHVIAEMAGYVSNPVVSKTIINKSRANISVMSFDNGEGLTERSFPFDIFAQIIEGDAEIVIDKVCHLLFAGQGIIIPADTPILITPNGRFKMIQTTLKTDANKYSPRSLQRKQLSI